MPQFYVIVDSELCLLPLVDGMPSEAAAELYVQQASTMGNAPDKCNQGCTLSTRARPVLSHALYLLATIALGHSHRWHSHSLDSKLAGPQVLLFWSVYSCSLQHLHGASWEVASSTTEGLSHPPYYHLLGLRPSFTPMTS